MRSPALAADDSGSGDRAAALAEAFDRGFAAPPAAAMTEQVDLIGMRFGGGAFAVRLAETAGLFAGRKVTPLPTSVTSLRGIAGLRGAVVPVYDLGVLVGFPPAVEMRWLILAREAAAAFAFDEFDGQLRVGRDALVVHQAPREHVREVVHQGVASRPIIHLPSVIAALRAHTPAKA